jgi:NADH-ubiquinone oxidoreductase chain 5
MPAPTPVPALVHSSTFVTAGGYFLIRFSPSFGYLLNIILLLISGLTIFMAGLGANFEYNLKNIIGLSTLRQLGLMILFILYIYIYIYIYIIKSFYSLCSIGHP